MMVTLQPGSTLSRVRFAAESQPLAKKFARTSLDRHSQLSENKLLENTQTTSLSKQLKKLGLFTTIALGSLGALVGGGYMGLNYRANVPTAEQVTNEQKALWQQRSLEPVAQKLLKLGEHFNNTAASKILTVEQLRDLKSSEANFFSTFGSILRESSDEADRTLGNKMYGQDSFVDMKSGQMTQDLLAYLKDQESKGQGLQVEAYLAKLPEFSEVSSRQREYLASHIANLYNETAEPAEAIEGLLKIQVFSKMTGLGVADLQAVQTSQQLVQLVEKGLQNPAVYPQLTPQERELLQTRSKEYLTSLDYKPLTPPSGWQMFGAIALLAGGLIGTGVSTYFGVTSVHEKMRKRAKRADFLASQSPTIIIQKSALKVDAEQKLADSLSQKALNLFSLRQYAAEADPEVNKFFATIGSRRADALKDFYLNRAQNYFLKSENRKVVSNQEYLEKAQELLQEDLDNFEYLPELAFDKTDEVPRLIVEELRGTFTQQHLDQVMARLDADVMINIRQEMNQRILMAETKRKFAVMEEQANRLKTEGSQPAPSQELPRTARLLNSPTFKQQSLEQLELSLEDILKARVALENARLSWQMTWLQHNENAQCQTIVDSVEAFRRKVDAGEKAENNEVLRSLQHEVKVGGRAVEIRIEGLSEQQQEAVKTLEAARKKRTTSSKKS